MNLSRARFSKRIISYLCVLCCCVVAMGCQGIVHVPEEPEVSPYTLPAQESVQVSLYFPNEQGNLVAEIREIRLKSSEESIYKRIVQEMIEGPKTSLLPVCSSDTSLNSVYVIDDILLVDLEKNQKTSNQMEKFRISLAETFHAFAGVNYVVVTVQGAVPTTIQNPVYNYSSEESQKAILYFPAIDSDQLIPSITSVEKISIVEIISALTEPLDDTLPLKEAYALNSDVVLETSLFEEDGSIFLYLTGDEQAKPDSFGAASIALSIFSNIPGAHTVTIYYNGQLIDESSGALQKEEVLNLRSCYRTIYLPNQSNSALLPITVSVPIEQADDIFMPVRLVLNPELRESFATELAKSVISDSYFISGSLYGDLAVLNFTPAFYEELNAMEEDAARILLYAIVNTMVQTKFIDCVLFYCEGKPVEKVHDYYLAQPLYENPGLIFSSGVNSINGGNEK